MTVHIPTSTNVTGSHALTINTVGDTLFVQPNVFLAASGANFHAVNMTAGSITATINGALISDDSTALQFQNLSEVTIGQTGSVTGQSGVIMEDDNSFTNAGTITANLRGIRSAYSGNTISNSGTITAADGIYIGAIQFAPELLSTEIHNSGTITAHNEGIFIWGYGNTVSNSGTVIADVTAVDFRGQDTFNAVGNTLGNSESGVLSGGAHGVLVESDFSQISNAGLIQGGNNTGVQVQFSSHVQVVNSGQL